MYSGLTWEPQPLPGLVKRILQRIDVISGHTFNSCLCNLYRDGSDCVGYHADDEPLFGGDPIVASVSFGATRTFKLRRNDGTDKREFFLENGHVLFMGLGIQREWKHSIPKTKKPCGERINLTFRNTV
jgi:alkylated DNA repair dioxygenase AlkB